MSHLVYLRHKYTEALSSPSSIHFSGKTDFFYIHIQNYDWECNIASDKYDDREGFLGYVPQETQPKILLCHEKQKEN